MACLLAFFYIQYSSIHLSKLAEQRGIDET